jgi:hypothetical protein
VCILLNVQGCLHACLNSQGQQETIKKKLSAKPYPRMTVFFTTRVLETGDCASDPHQLSDHLAGRERIVVRSNSRASDEGGQQGEYSRTHALDRE